MRRLHLIDIESLRSALLLPTTADSARRALLLHRAMLAPDPIDVVVVGCSAAWLFAARTVWPEARVVTDPIVARISPRLTVIGEDLLNSDSYDEVVISSGDDWFVTWVRKLAGNGVRITVVAPLQTVSSGLWRVADRVVPFIAPQGGSPEAA